MAIKREYIKSGRFMPRNPERYKGDPSKIYYRSSWEARVMLKLDTAPGIIWWSSEEVVVNYLNPVTGVPARYYPDFVVRLHNADGDLETIMIEVKPVRQTRPPKKLSEKTRDPKRIRSYIASTNTYKINMAKWKAAQNLCKRNGWKFKIMTEDNIF